MSIILSQLGGSRFLAMTGAKNLVKDGDKMLMFSLPKNKSGGNRVRIELNGFDLYDMQFFALKNGGLDLVKLNNYGNIGAEELAEIFTNETGLYTKL